MDTPKILSLGAHSIFSFSKAKMNFFQEIKTQFPST